MTYQVLEKSLSTTGQTLDKTEDKQTLNVPSTQTHTSQEVRISTTTYSYVLRVESKEIVYRSLPKEKV